MNVILHAANYDGPAIVVFQNAAEITVQLIAQRFVLQLRAAIFG
jgi:hypothetical protein